MVDIPNDQLEKIKLLNIDIRRRLELAEARVEDANIALAQLAATGLLNEQIFLGDVTLVRGYNIGDSSSSGQLIQAALAIPNGFGAVLWDSEEFEQLRRLPGFEAEASLLFVPFEQCSSAVKASLLSQIEPLLDQLLGALGTS